jgi:uncharacterized protein (DUF2062 family)
MSGRNRVDNRVPQIIDVILSVNRRNWHPRVQQEFEAMLMVMLIAAVMVSLAFGVLMAYGICYGMFQVFRIHSRTVRQSRVQTQLVAER